MITSLMFMTLFAGAAIGIIQFFWFLRRSRNRDIAANALVGSGRPTAVSMHPEGALSEILGLGALGLLAMALLLFGYQQNGYESAANVPPPASSSATVGSGNSAARPMTQPATPRSNPADMPNAPTTFPDASGNPVDPTKNNPPNTAR